MGNALVTWASGEELCRSDSFKVYRNSSQLVKADRYVLTHDMPEDVEKELISEGFIVERVNPALVYNILRDRHFHFFEFLVESDYDNYGFTDCKDVVFQSDPFEYFDPFLRNCYYNEVVVTCEGMSHQDSDWNLKDQFQAQISTRQFKIPFDKQPVINGGVIFGKGDCLKYHFLLLWIATLQNLGCGTDQGILNYLYSFLKKINYHHTDPRADSFCLTGEGAKCGYVEYDFKYNLFYHIPHTEAVERSGLLEILFPSPSNPIPYCIIHQWDRLPEAELIKKHWVKS